MERLKQIKMQEWFYEFNLPDGTKTASCLPEFVRKIHYTRELVLRRYLDSHRNIFSNALDVSCHEGYFSAVMSEYLKSVVGIDKNPESLKKAKLILNALNNEKVKFVHTTVENYDEKNKADFVLCFGLLYHVENPIQVLKKLSILTKKTLCIESQVLPFDIKGQIEDGCYLWQRELKGSFGLCRDYSDRREGGLTDLALVPSRDALEFILTEYGFKTVEFYQPEPGDYEQFVRRARVIVFAEKS